MSQAQTILGIAASTTKVSLRRPLHIVLKKVPSALQLTAHLIRMLTRDDDYVQTLARKQRYLLLVLHPSSVCKIHSHCHARAVLTHHFLVSVFIIYVYSIILDLSD